MTQPFSAGVRCNVNVLKLPAIIDAYALEPPVRAAPGIRPAVTRRPWCFAVQYPGNVFADAAL